MIHSEPNIIETTPEMRERIEQFKQEHAGDEIGSVGTTLLWEDDRVKIWEMALEPGEHSPLRRHDHDYYLAIWEGDYVAGVTPDRSEVESFVCKLPEVGNTVSIPKGGTEWAFNIGNERYREVMIELKDT